MDLTLFDFLIRTVMTTGGSLRGLLAGYWPPLLGALLTLVLTWTFVKHLLGDGFAETVVSAMQSIFMALVLVVLLGTWTTPIPLPGGKTFTVADYFVGGMNEVALAVQGGNNMPALFTKMTRQVMGVGTTVAETCVEENLAYDGMGNQTPGNTNIACSPTDPNAATSLWSFKSMLNLGDFIIAIAMRLVALILLIITFIFYECVMLLSVMFVDIGLILGPVLLPWLIWRPSAFLFDGWLKLMISGGLYKIVASIILVYVSAVFNALNNADTSPLNEAGLSAGIQTALAFGTMLVAGAGLYLMMQIQSIVGTIVGGGGIDMSPRLGRAMGSVMRVGGAMSKVGGAISKSNAAYQTKQAAMKANAAAAPFKGRLGGQAARGGGTSRAAVTAKANPSGGAWGRQPKPSK